MRVIVPGGYYSYDSEGKKIWLDYQYYGTTLENIEKINNLTRNMILYDSKNIKVLPTVSNGCITHSYQGTEDDTDKIQVTLKTPITNSLTELTPVDGVVTLETDGKVLVLPTANAAILPSYNDRVLDPNRLTIAESPFGGLKGSGSPDYAPGTLYTPTDGIYLTDTSGTNPTKTLTAGKLKELSLLTVDTKGHTITEEFIIANTATSNSPSVIDDCSSATGWSILNGSGEITVESGRIKVAGTSDSSGYLTIQKTVTLNLSAYTIFGCLLESNVAGSAYIQIKTGTPYKVWDSATRFILAQNTNSRFFLPLLAPQGTTGQNPSTVSGTFALASTSLIAVGVKIGNSAACTFYVDDITADTAKSAYIELQTPDNLSATSTIVQCYSGSTYSECRRDSLDSTYSNISSTPANMKLLDGTLFDHVYGNNLGRAYFPKGASGETKAGSTGSITYSANKGTSKRIGFRVDLPPADNRGTKFNQIRVRSILSYTDTVGNVVPDLSGNGNTGTIVGNIIKGVNYAIGSSASCIRCSTYPKTFLNHIIIHCIITTPTNITADQTIFGIEDMFKIGIQSSKFKTLIKTTDVSWASSVYTSNLTLSPETKYDVSVVYNGIDRKIYIDNLLDGSIATTGNIGTTAIYSLALLGTSVPNLSFVGKVHLAEIFKEGVTLEDIEYLNPSVRYSPTVANMGSTTHDFADSTNTSYGLQNLSKPWIALYDPANSLIDFYLFTHRPQNLSFKRDETGTIYSLSLYPGAGSVYHGQIPFADLTRDTNSDSVPDCLEAAVNGSVTKFLENYTMVI